VSCEFSVGWAITDKERAAISAIPAQVWADAVDADGDSAGLAEITHVLPVAALSGYPCGIRVIVRRERPHPGAQLDAFEERDGWRYTAFATDTAFGRGSSRTSMRSITRTPALRIASAPRRTPVWTTSRPEPLRSTLPALICARGTERWPCRGAAPTSRRAYSHPGTTKISHVVSGAKMIIDMPHWSRRR
jgi:hypothetical protein